LGYDNEKKNGMGMGNLKDKTTDREVGFGGAHQTRAPALKKEKKKTKTSQPSTANACVNDPKKGNTRTTTTTTTHFLKGKERKTTTGTAINQNKKIQKALREWLFLVHDITSRKVGSCHPFFSFFRQLLNPAPPFCGSPAGSHPLLLPRFSQDSLSSSPNAPKTPW